MWNSTFRQNFERIKKHELVCAGDLLPDSSRDWWDFQFNNKHGNGMPFFPLLPWEPGEMLCHSELMHWNPGNWKKTPKKKAATTCHNRFGWKILVSFLASHRRSVARRLLNAVTLAGESSIQQRLSYQRSNHSHWIAERGLEDHHPGVHRIW